MLKNNLLLFLGVLILPIASFGMDISEFYRNLFKANFTAADSLISLENSDTALFYKFLKETYILNHYEAIPNKKKIEKIKRKALKRIESLLRKASKEEQASLYFFKGCILSYAGIIATQQGSFFKGLSLAFDGVDALEEALELDENSYDALMMKEIYTFYKGKKLKFLFHNKKKIIANLLKYYKKTKLIKPLAASSLIIILRNEGLYKKAYQIASEVNNEYGTTRYYLRPIIKLDIMAGNFELAIKRSKILINLLKKDPLYQDFNLYKAYYELVKASYLAKDEVTFASAISNLEKITLSSDDLDKMGDRPEFIIEMKNNEYEL